MPQLHVLAGNLVRARQSVPGSEHVGTDNGALRLCILQNMTPADACLQLAQDLPVSLIRSLIQQLRSGAEPAIPNPAYQARVDELLNHCRCVRSSLADMLEVAIASKAGAPTAELVWTGPAATGVPSRATEQVLVEIIAGAERQLLIMSFGIFQIARVVNTLEQAINRGIRVQIVLGDRESHSDIEISRHRHELGGIISHRASLFQWCPTRRLRDENGRAGLMHAKAAIADSRVCFITSANLTEAAFERNIEIGIVIRGGNIPVDVERLVDSLIVAGELQSI